MKKEGIVLAVALLFLTVSGIRAIDVVEQDLITGNIIRVQGDDLTGDVISGKATSQGLGMNITVLPYQQIITIVQPENITYDFAANQSFLLNLSVYANFNVDSWWFSLYDMNHSEVIFENVSFVPNSNFTARKWENKLLVYANNSTGGVINASLDFYVNLNNTAPVISVETPLFACENSFFSQFFNVTDLNEKMRTVEMSPRQIFFLSNYTSDPDDYEFNYNVNHTTWAHEIFSVFLNKTHVGGTNNGYASYSRNILAWDGNFPVESGYSLNIKPIVINVLETNHLANVTNPGVHTIYGRGENSSFYHELWADDLEDGNITSGNLTANISFQGISLFEITPQGIMNFTSNTSEASVNNITVCVSDLGLQNPHPNISLCNQTGLSSSSCVNFSLTITNDNRQPNITSYWDLDLELEAIGMENIYFNITTYDPDGTIPDVRWYFSDVLVKYDTGLSFSEINHSFDCEVGGLQVVKVVITDGLLTDEMEWNVTVEEVPCPLPPQESAGGGGVSESRTCIPKWACRDWSRCVRITKLLNDGTLSREDYRNAREECEARGLKEAECGIQERICSDVNECYPDFLRKTEVQTCHYTAAPSCFDGIKNCHSGSCEILVDCGGPCIPCPTCSDGIQNQGEEGVDCGGPCPWSCEEEMPSPPEPNYRYSLLLLLILLLLYIINKTFRMIEKKSVHKNFILSVFLGVLLIFCLVFLYFYAYFHVGDFVYKKGDHLIGEVKNTSATLSHLIQWQDGTYSKEFIFSIGKVDDLKVEEIQEILDNNNQQDFSLYSWSSEGMALSEKVPIKRVQDLKEFTVKLKKEECTPSFICGPWSECKADYNFQKVAGEGLTKGMETRFCRDSSGCMADFIYSQSCILEEQILIYKSISSNEKYFEIYDVNNNLVARINKIIDQDTKRLNIEIIG